MDLEFLFLVLRGVNFFIFVEFVVDVEGVVKVFFILWMVFKFVCLFVCMVIKYRRSGCFYVWFEIEVVLLCWEMRVDKNGKV